MTQKISLLRWACWFTIFACVIAVHAVLKQDLRVFTPEVALHIKTVKDYEDFANVVLVVLYALVAMYPLSVMAKFLNAEGLANARQNLGKIKEATLPLPNIKGLDAGRKLHASHKLRQVEKDFLAVKNLYDHGLIDEKMFLKRKAELKAALGSNEMFSKDDMP